MYSDDHDLLLPPYPNDELFLLRHDPKVTTKLIPTDSDCPRMLIEVLLQ